MIPLLFERGYKPDGWLGILQGMDIYYHFHTCKKFEENFAELLKIIAESNIETSTDNVDGKSLKYFLLLYLCLFKHIQQYDQYGNVPETLVYHAKVYHAKELTCLNSKHTHLKTGGCAYTSLQHESAKFII